MKLRTSTKKINNDCTPHLFPLITPLSSSTLFALKASDSRPRNIEKEFTLEKTKRRVDHANIFVTCRRDNINIVDPITST